MYTKDAWRYAHPHANVQNYAHKPHTHTHTHTHLIYHLFFFLLPFERQFKFRLQTRVFVYLYVRVRIHTYIHTHTHTYLYLCTCVCIYVEWMNVFVYTCVCLKQKNLVESFQKNCESFLHNFHIYFRHTCLAVRSFIFCIILSISDLVDVSVSWCEDAVAILRRMSLNTCPQPCARV